MKLSIASTLVLVAQIGSVYAGVTNLTPENYDSATAGKSVFIKFFAPWCGHCKAMAADWEKLASDFESSDTKLIAEVDCTDDANQGICSENGVQGFPTLKYGNAAALDDYDGGRDYASLKSFADDKLKASCSPFNLDLCEGEEKAKIDAYFAMSADELKTKIDAVDEIIAAADKKFEEGLEGLQSKYMDMVEKHENAVEEEKEKKHYGTIKAVLAYRKSKGEKSTEDLEDEQDEL